MSSETPIILTACAVGFVASVCLVLLFERLETEHPEVWSALGKPGVKTFWRGGSGKLSWFVAYGGEFKALEDKIVSLYVLTIRISYVLFFLLLGLLLYSSAIGPLPFLRGEI